jgi:hypothetical protein
MKAKQICQEPPRLKMRKESKDGKRAISYVRQVWEKNL